MKLEEIEIDLDIILESARVAWGRRGNKVKKMFICTSGRRKGRKVAKVQQCSAPIDLKKRFTLKKTKAKMGKRMARKAKRTKRMNPASKRIQALNKRK